MSTVKVSDLLPGVPLLTLADPDRLNAMGPQMAEDFQAALGALQSPRALVITGEGRAFSAGGDLDMLEAKRKIDFEKNRWLMLEFYRSFLDVLKLEVPVIAAVNGLAVGAGFCLACACDLRVADPSARFSAPFLKLGLYPGMGCTHFLPRVLGSRAHDLLLSGRMLGAEEALQWGLVTRLSAPGGVLETAKALAQEVLEGAPLASRELLLSLRGGPEALQSALQREAEGQARSYARPEFGEGLARARKKGK